MWQKITKIKVIPINGTVDILLSNYPKMDDLLVAYENQNTGSLWKIIQTSPKTDLVRFKALPWEKFGVLQLVVAPHLFVRLWPFEVKTSFDVGFPWYVIVSVKL